MKCPKCDSEINSHSVDGFVVNYCKTCWDFIESKPIPCETHNPIFVIFTYETGATHIRMQCMACGKIDARNYPKESVPNWQNLPHADKDLRNKFENRETNNLNQILSRYEIKRKEFKKSNYVNSHIERQKLYLQSEDWKIRKSLILKRDNYLCQSCLEKEATEVHHKYNVYWQNEPLFEFTSLCIPCFELVVRINLDQNLNKKQPT